MNLECIYIALDLDLDLAWLAVIRVARPDQILTKIDHPILAYISTNIGPILLKLVPMDRSQLVLAVHHQI